jgi:hypothetical protein
MLLCQLPPTFLALCVRIQIKVISVHYNGYGILYIKATWCLSVVTNRAGAGQGRAGGQGKHPPTAGHFQLRLEKQQWWCLSVCGQCLEDSSTARSLWSFPRYNSPDVTDSREKRNQGQSDFLR